MLPKSNNFNYKSEYKYSNEDPISFWDRNAKIIHWDKQYDQVYSGNELKPDWFKGGMLNTCYNVLDKHMNDPSQRNRYALICECPFLKTCYKITYLELYEKVCKFSGILISLGVSKGDRVLVYMPTSIEAAIVMFSCARIGAIHVVTYGGYSAYNLLDLIESCKPKLMVVTNYGFSTSEIISYTPNVIKALQLSTHKIDNIITFNRNDHFDIEFVKSIDSVPNSLDWDDLMNQSKPFRSYIPVESSHPLYILYSSGTTGKPKGIVRDNAGHLVSNEYYYTILCPQERAVVFTASNIGWVSGHCFLYNSTFNGGTYVMFEGESVVINHDIVYWSIMEKHKVNYFFSSPSVIRTIMKYDPKASSILKYDLSNLDTIWIGGEVVDEDALGFIRNVVGKRIFNIMGQTESSTPLLMSFEKGEKPNRIGQQSPSIIIEVLSEDGIILPNNEIGELVIKLPLPPGFVTTLYNDYESFYNYYFSTYKGYYKTGDLGFRDQDGYFGIVSRADDYINVSCIKIKSSSIEEVILNNQKIVECSCFGIKDEINGEIPIAFVVLKNEFKDGYNITQLKDELNTSIKEKYNEYAILKKLYIVKRLPKTRSGKNTKSILKKIININGYEIPQSVEEPELLNEILSLYKQQNVY